HVACPFADRIPVGRGVGILPVWTPVSGNDSVRIAGDVLVEEDGLLRQLDDLPRRANARNAGLAAVENGIGSALVIGQVLQLCEMLRLIGRAGRRRLDAEYGAGVTMARALIDLVNRDLAVNL